MVPLTINCWPSISGNESYVNIEYECQVDFDLQNIVVAIPCHQPPKVNQVCCLCAFWPSQPRIMCCLCSPYAYHHCVSQWGSKSWRPQWLVLVSYSCIP